MIREFIASHRLFTVLFIMMVSGGIGLAVWLPKLFHTVWLVLFCLAYGFIYGMYLGLAIADLSRMHDERRR